MRGNQADSECERQSVSQAVGCTARSEVFRTSQKKLYAAPRTVKPVHHAFCTSPLWLPKLLRPIAIIEIEYLPAFAMCFSPE